MLFYNSYLVVQKGVLFYYEYIKDHINSIFLLKYIIPSYIHYEAVHDSVI